MKILGLDYTILRGPKVEESEYWGRHNAYDQTIKIAEGITKQAAESVMLHEIIEAINDRLALKMEHSLIYALETSLYETLVNAGVEMGPLHPDNIIIGRRPYHAIKTPK